MKKKKKREVEISIYISSYSLSTTNANITRFTFYTEQLLLYSLSNSDFSYCNHYLLWCMDLSIRPCISLFCPSTNLSVLLSELYISFFVAITNLMTIFIVETYSLQFSFVPSRVLLLPSFQLFHPLNIYTTRSYPIGRLF